jgi:hypothetical protein
VKKKALLIALALTLFCTALLGIACTGSADTPYKKLSADKITSATVLITGTNGYADQVELTRSEINELIAILNKLQLATPDGSYQEYGGGLSMYFTLVRADGKEETIGVYSGFVIVNGVGYQSEDEHFKAVSRELYELGATILNQKVLA